MISAINYAISYIQVGNCNNLTNSQVTLGYYKEPTWTVPQTEPDGQLVVAHEDFNFVTLEPRIGY